MSKTPTPEEYLEYLTSAEDMLKAQLKVIKQQKKLTEMAIKSKEFMTLFNPLTFFSGIK